jgi:hypothetical protein
LLIQRAIDKEEENSLKRSFGQAALAIIASCMLLLLVATPKIHADDRDKCQHAIDKAEAKLDEAIRKHGDHSHEADERRRDLNAERERCWNEYHQWWNGKEHRWETEHNWNDNDYDHH